MNKKEKSLKHQGIVSIRQC